MGCLEMPKGYSFSLVILFFCCNFHLLACDWMVIGVPNFGDFDREK